MGNLKKEERKRIEAEIWSRAQCDTRSSNIISDRHRVTQGRMQEQSSIGKDFSLTRNCTRSWHTGLCTLILQKMQEINYLSNSLSWRRPFCSLTMDSIKKCSVPKSECMPERRTKKRESVKKHKFFLYFLLLISIMWPLYASIVLICSIL